MRGGRVGDGGLVVGAEGGLENISGLRFQRFGRGEGVIGECHA